MKNKIYTDYELLCLERKAKLYAKKNHVSEDKAFRKIAWDEGYRSFPDLIRTNLLLVEQIETVTDRSNSSKVSNYTPPTFESKKHTAKITVKKKRKAVIPEDVKQLLNK